MRLEEAEAGPVAGGTTVPADDLAALVRDLLGRRGEARWVARGRSMRGSIPDGTEIRLVAPPPDGPRRGDVAMAVLPDGRLVLHRVVSVADGTVRLRGDACRRCDPPVPVEAVVAVADPRPRRSPWSLVWRMVP